MKTRTADTGDHSRRDQVAPRHSYWRQRLANIPVLQLPTDHPRQAEPATIRASRPFRLSVPLIRAHDDLGSRVDASLFSTLLAAFKVLLYRYTGQEDIAVGSPVADQVGGASDGKVEPLEANLVLRTNLSGNPTFLQVLGRVREVVLDAYDHRDVPLAEVLAELHASRDPSLGPPVQAFFAVQDVSGQVSDLGRGPMGAVLECHLREENQGISGLFLYDAHLFDEGTIARMTGHFETLLAGIVANPHERIGELPLLTEGEHHRMLVEWNDTVAKYLRDRCVHELFEERVVCTPDAAAVIVGDQQLTYRELNRRANRLARHVVVAQYPTAIVFEQESLHCVLVPTPVGIASAGSSSQGLSLGTRTRTPSRADR